MATIIFSAIGAAAGASIGGGVLGLSSVLIGRAFGATAGRLVDQSILGAGSDPVETGRVDRFRLTGASEGAPIAQLYGRNRVAGQVIWATRFQENAQNTGSGKGSFSGAGTTSYSYSVSLAIALCEGEITRVGRIWADGQEIGAGDLNLRLYTGAQDQMPDPKIEAVNGAGRAPAYRGVAYVVIEDLNVTRFGNRVPQFTFEVMRPEQPQARAEIARATRAVAMIPGTGEYALATTAVHYQGGAGVLTPANTNTPAGVTDFTASLEALSGELPNCGATSLVVSWFGDDLRCGQCTLRPKVEQTVTEGREMPWTVSGENRATASAVPVQDARPVYGGTPTDQSVKEALIACVGAGKAVTFYPFILMEQLEGNSLTDPYTGASGQPALPWRGRITTSAAPGLAGSPDQTAGADGEVAAFFGQANVADFTVTNLGVDYTGPAEWSYRRFILHYAHLCASAGGVDAFVIGSEMRGLTQIRGAGGNFPAVDALIALAADVRAVLGPDTKISYAADWSEYFGYHPQDGSGDVWFHLDPLWADANIDFIGIDNYMPLSDWREGDDHADANWGAIYNLEYLKSNVMGGEGYDWYYHAPEADKAQLRTPITDEAYGEPWVWRYKDIRGWWSNTHHNRVAGVRSAMPTPWVPGAKPVWFTEFGCAAVNKGTNQPNRFVDPKSSESGVPKYSDGRRDDLIQMQYLRAVTEFWGDPANNITDPQTGVQMIDMARAHVWAWDARPYPFFPGNRTLWSDGGSYARGHWLNGRSASRSLASVVGEICERSGLYDYDVSRLYGVVRGYTVGDVAGARAALQPLMLAYGVEAAQREGTLVFTSRDGRAKRVLDPAQMALTGADGRTFERSRAPAAQIAGRLRLNYVEAEADYETRASEAHFPDEVSRAVSLSELALVLTQAEARAIVERWLAESRIARDVVRFAVPPSGIANMAGDVVEISDEDGAGNDAGTSTSTSTSAYRLDRVDQGGTLMIEAVRVEPGVYTPSDSAEAAVRPRPFAPAVPVLPLFMDLPLLSGQEVEHAPHLAVTATPWPGSVAVYSAPSDQGYTLNRLIGASAVVGVTQTPLLRARPGLIDQGPALQVALGSGALASVSQADMLNGANLAAIGDGSPDNWEVFQFAGADLIAPGVYQLTHRLRGQAGTDATAPETWPQGSYFVLLNGAVGQIDLGTAARGLLRHYRIGPSQRPYDDPVYEHQVASFSGIGLRPLSPVHLTAQRDGAGDLALSWVRRTRIDGDSWQSSEVPLGEAGESYILRVLEAGVIKRELTLTSAAWVYSAALQSGDGVSPPFQIDIAQVSDRFGPGPFRRLEVTA